MMNSTFLMAIYCLNYYSAKIIPHAKKLQKKQKNAEIFGQFKKKLYLCSRFARCMCARHVNIFINRLCWAVDLPLNGIC